MKKVEEILKKLIEYDLSYSDVLDYDYDRVEARDHDIVCADDYCRCTSLENFEINTINVHTLVNGLKNYLGVEHNLFDKDIIEVCEKLGKEDFEFDTSGGYYGEELDSILIDNREILTEIANIFSIKGYRKMKIKKIISNSDTIVEDYILDDYVKRILTEEYGYVLDSLIVSKFKIIEIDPKDVIFPQKDYNTFIKSQNLSGYRNRKGICGLVRMVGDKYHVIDGYHRINANINKSTIKVILAYS